MTIDELREWIKDEIVLHEGDVADWQWRQRGLTAEAKSLGLSDADFNRLVNQVSLNVQPDFGKISAIRSSILTLARQRRGKFTTVDMESLVSQAETARLSRAFVTEKWIPALLQTLPVEPEISSSQPLPTPIPIPPVTEPVRSTGETADSMRRKVTESLDDFKGRIPAPAIRSLFRMVNYDEAELAVAIWSYLQIHQYVADQEPTGDTLREKLVSTDWQSRPTPQPIPEPSKPLIYDSPAPVVHSFTATPARVHQGQPVTLAWEVENLLAVTIDDLGEGLSPNNRGWVKPSKTMDYTLFDANNNPLSTVRVEVIPRDRSGVYGVLFAMALLAIIYWFIKSSNSKDGEPRPKPKTERTSSRQAQPPAVSAVSQPQDANESETSTASDTTTKATDEAPLAAIETPQREESKALAKPVNEDMNLPEPEVRSTTPSDARQGKYVEAFGNKPYDKVELGADERGWRRARSNGRWGYVNEADDWVINPEYEAVTSFRGNTAIVFLNGQQITINRSGEQVRN